MSTYTFISNKKYNLIDLQNNLNSIFSISNIQINNLIYHSDDYELIISLSSNLDISGYTLLESSILNYSLSNKTVTNIIYEPDIITTARILEDVPIFKSVKTWNYPGANIKNLGKIEFTGYLKENYINEHLNSNFNYSIRMMDVTNNNIIGIGTYSNYIDLDNSFLISNLNKNKANLELQLQKNSELGNYIELNSLTFNYIL